MTRAPKPRHAADGGYTRGEETRARIVAAALKLFGDRGFDGASTRDIAMAADVNAPALQYYFNNKEGVYLACTEHIVSRLLEHLGQVLGHAEQVLADGGGDEALIDAFCGIQERVADFMFTSEEHAAWRLFIAREQAGLDPAVDSQTVSQRLGKPMLAITSAIVGRLLGQPASDEETQLTAMTLNGQLAMFQVMRRAALARLNWDTIDARRTGLLKRVVIGQTRTLMFAMVARREAAK
ncbi:CerR family C-terminal domain-containing protein [Xylophilus sp. GW821-FHT01B05]